MIGSFLSLRRSSIACLITVALLWAGPAAAATTRPIGEWKFRGNFKNHAKTQLRLRDVPVGSLGFVTTTIDGKNVTACVVGAGRGLKISRIPRSARENFTVDIFFATPEVTAFERLMSFGPNNVDRGLYVVGGKVELYPGTLGTNVSIAPNTWVHVAVTRAAKTGRLKVYVDGVLELSYSDKAGDFTLRKGQVVIFQDDGEEHMYGMVKNVRVYDRALLPS